MKEEVFYKHVRETTFTKDYTVCGKVIVDNTIPYWPNYELHIGVYVFPVNDLFIKKVGCTNSLAEVEKDAWMKIKIDEYSLHTFLDFCKVFTPSKAVKKKVYMDYVIE